MLVLAGILFLPAVLLWFADHCTIATDIDLFGAALSILFISALLIGRNPTVHPNHMDNKSK